MKIMSRQHSIDVAIKEYDELIEKTYQDCKEISAIIDNPKIPLEQKSNKLYIELAQKERYLKELITRREELEDMSQVASYNGLNTEEGKVSYRDKKINDRNEAIAKYKRVLANTSEKSKNPYVILSRKRAKTAIENLKKKNGITKGKQKKVINARLKTELKAILKESKKLAKIDALNDIIAKYEGIQDKMADKAEMAFDKNRNLAGMRYVTKCLASKSKAGMLNTYLNMLQGRKGKVDGFNKVSDRFRMWLANKIMPKEHART